VLALFPSFQSRNLVWDRSLMPGNSAKDSTILRMFSKNLYISICIKAVLIWEEHVGSSATISGKR